MGNRITDSDFAQFYWYNRMADYIEYVESQLFNGGEILTFNEWDELEDVSCDN